MVEPIQFIDRSKVHLEIGDIEMDVQVQPDLIPRSPAEAPPPSPDFLRRLHVAALQAFRQNLEEALQTVCEQEGIDWDQCRFVTIATGVTELRHGDTVLLRAQEPRVVQDDQGVRFEWQVLPGGQAT